MQENLDDHVLVLVLIVIHVWNGKSSFRQIAEHSEGN